MKKKHWFILCALTTLTGTSVPQAAFAATTPLMKNISIQLNTQPINTTSELTQNGNPYIPLWYIMQVLNHLHISTNWTNQNWSLTVNPKTYPNYQNIKLNSEKNGVYINGIQVASTTTLLQIDPRTHQNTIYLPVSVVQSVLQRIGVLSTWNGTTWQLQENNFNVFSGTGKYIGTVQNYNQATQLAQNQPGGEIVDEYGNVVSTTPIYKTYSSVHVYMNEYPTLQAAIQGLNGHLDGYVLDQNGNKVYQATYQAYSSINIEIGDYPTQTLAQSALSTHPQGYVVSGLTGKKVFLEPIFIAYSSIGVPVGYYITESDAQKALTPHPKGYVKNESGVIVYTQPMPAAPTPATLKEGDTGSLVKTLQSDLNQLGDSVGVVDGNFGPMTLAGVKKFQSDHQISPTGIVGATTWKAIETALNPPSQPVLQEGDTGNLVKTLQSDLNQLGDSVGVVDGNFGPMTLAGVKKFQSDHQISPTGIVDATTWKAIETALQPPSSKNAFTLAGWAVDNASLADAIKHASITNEIDVDEFSFAANGYVSGNAPSPTISGITSYETVTNQGFNQSILTTMLQSSQNQLNLENNLVATAKKYGYQGINLDFEIVPANDRIQFSNFVKNLSIKLHQNGLQLNVTVPPKTGGDQPAWYQGYDYQAIGQYADEVSIMAYDYTFLSQAPGPVAPLWWDQNILQYAKTVIPASKILLGIGMYGYNWTAPGNAYAVTENDMDNLVKTNNTAQIHWDSKDSVPYITYQNAGVSHTVYYENQQSATDKVQLAQQEGVGGVAIWRFGYEDGNFYTIPFHKN